MTLSVELAGRKGAAWSLGRRVITTVWRPWIVAVIVVGDGLAVSLAADPDSANLTSRIILWITAVVGMMCSVAVIDAVPVEHPHARSERLIRAVGAATVLALAVAGVMSLLGDTTPTRSRVAAAGALAWVALVLVARSARRVACIVVAETPAAGAELARRITDAGCSVVDRVVAADGADLRPLVSQLANATVVVDPALLQRGIDDDLLRQGGGRLLCLLPGPHAARVRLAPMGELSLVDVTADPLLPGCRATKRAMDVVVATTVLTATLPLVLLSAIAIRVDSPGGWLFRQVRVGIGGRPFRMYKLRTMRTDQGSDRHRDYVAGLIDGTSEQVGGIYKLADDDRRTRVGRFLRHFSIDELPQLWNVLRGDMSLVGPRPALAHEVERYGPRALQRLAIQPGLTGLWQVSGRSRLGYDRMIELDAEYWQEWSLLLDVRILLKTPMALLRGETA